MKAGKLQKPEWLVQCEKQQREQERKRPRDESQLPATIRAAKKAANTQQLALKEREAERAALKDRLKAAQEERKAHLERLKNQIQKRIQGTHAATNNKKRKGVLDP